MANQRSTQASRRRVHQPEGLDVWQRLTRLLAVMVVLVVGALAFVYFVPEKEKLNELKATNARLTERRDQLLAQKAEKLRLEKESDRSAYLEVIGRDLLNLQLPGETVIRIDNGGFQPARRR